MTEGKELRERQREKNCGNDRGKGGEEMTKEAKAYRMKFEPLVLKELILECDIPQGGIARATRLSRPAVNLAINRGYLPVRCPEFKKNIEKILRENTAAMQWLLERGIKVEDVWQPLGREMRNSFPKGAGKRIRDGKRFQAMLPGNPDIITISWEVEMITQEAMRHFKLFRNPFIDDIQKDADIYMSDEHCYIEAAMLDAARHGGFLAVIGEVGSGKSVMRRKVVEHLRKDGDVIVIFPHIVDKTRLTAASICDAIVMDLSDEKPKIRLEQKTRQVQKLLLERSKQGYRSVLIIEEAHDMDTKVLKYLKRFYEIEDGYKKLLGIILIGQTELKHTFTEAQHVGMREVIRRVQIAEIKGLNGNIKDYLELKFNRVNAEVDKVFDGEAFKALSKRLTSTDRQNKTISHAYPLLVNNYTAKAMNLAYEMGERMVTENVVLAI